MPAPRDQGVLVNVTQSLSITYLSATAAVAGQLVDYAGNLAVSAATPVYGVLRDDATQNRVVSIVTDGLVEVLSGGAVAIGNAICADATGRGAATGAGNQCLGRAVSAASAAGQRFQMLITREGTN
jgi:Uncharacterized conserved protein (DUF2190)